MDLTATQLQELESLAVTAVRRAGERVEARAGESVEAQHKSAGSSVASQVVTEVDLESQRLILEVLGESLERFQLGLLTEESPDDSSRHQRDHFWCIDPLDGTLAFTKGGPGYAVSIALVGRDGRPLIGVVFDPVTGTLFQAARGQGAKKNGEPWVPARKDKTLRLFIDHSFIGQAARSGFRDRLDALAARHGCENAEIINHQGAVLNACSVADHAPALYFKAPKPQAGGGSLWDFAASACLFAELGLPASDFHGQPMNLNPSGDTFMNHKGVCFASESRLAAEAMTLMA